MPLWSAWTVPVSITCGAVSSGAFRYVWLRQEQRSEAFGLGAVAPGLASFLRHRSTSFPIRRLGVAGTGAGAIEMTQDAGKKRRFLNYPIVQTYKEFCVACAVSR